jgi:hypothetical protein
MTLSVFSAKLLFWNEGWSESCMNVHLFNICSDSVRVMVFNATFSNISVISWRSVLLVEETGVPGENHRPAASH